MIWPRRPSAHGWRWQTPAAAAGGAMLPVLWRGVALAWRRWRHAAAAATVAAAAMHAAAAALHASRRGRRQTWRCGCGCSRLSATTYW